MVSIVRRRGQAVGKAAKKHTAALTARKAAKIKVYDTDRYGRKVGLVFANGVSVNESLIKKGLAWQYRKYCKASFCAEWLQFEEKAKDPVPPWEWRKGARNSSYVKSTP